VIIIGVAIDELPVWALLGMLILPLGTRAMMGALKYHDDIAKLIPVLGMDVIVVLLTPTLMSIGIVIATYTS
jgi:1,4-dihydroxy-2-naphthoate octaprenyltransferase